MTTLHRKLRFAPIAALAMSAGATLLATQAAEMPDSERVTSLLSEVRDHAYRLQGDAELLQSFTWTTGVNWQSHAAVVTRMKDDINEAGRKLTKLGEAKKSASPWQKTAIERIEPPLRELAANTEKAINYINANPGSLFREEYKDYIEANADLSADLSSMIADFVRYGTREDRLGELAKKLELPAKR
jgi:hypothetical protein